MSLGASPPSAKELVIFLVHGTWPRLFFRKTKTWFEEGSFFRDELQRRLAADLRIFAKTASAGLVHFEPLKWSGGNSFFERERAADALVDRIRVVRGERPTAHFFFVGHSHGGNVILRAIRKLNLRVFVPDVITMATPFVEVETQEGPHRLTDYRLQSISIQLSLAAVFLGVMLKGIDSDIVWGVATWVGLALFSIATFFRNRIDFVQNPYTSSIRDMAQQESASYGNLLVLRGYDDEATLALIFGRIGSRLSSILIGQVSRMTWWATPFLGFSGLVLLLAFNSSRAFGWVLAGSLLLYSVLGFICQLTSATVGRELLRGALQLYVAVNSVPSFGGTTSVRKTIYPENKAGLRHALYNIEQCIAYVSEWIAFRYSENSQGSFKVGQPNKAAPDGAPR